MRPYLSLFATVSLLAAPAFAQTAMPPAPPPDAVTGGTAASTANANRQAADAIDAREDAAIARVNAINAASADQYAIDMANYDTAVRAQHAEQVAQMMRYRHQRRAYADAMVAWRAQVAACKAGNNAACRAPTPDPAAFW
ncbi:MAG: hypothetical protein J0I47_10325 [Sphingomonas sp.]|uniref:hypothetical protein n=1 Tax=Sphingomonas sp. TaxID=28214 RepID=UPI001AC44FFF|nr:hypothetical protein [Sphingomonas sp.]MBN8808609.1 hypothetical protein [Sphingomonas sp.]